MRSIDIESAGPMAAGMINQQTILFIYSVVSVNRNIVGYNKYLQVITVVVVSVIVVVIAIFVRIF